MSAMRSVGLPLLVVLSGLLIAAGMFMLRSKTKKGGGERSAPHVALQPIQTGPTAPVIEASGVVEPDRRISLVPEVNGRVVRQAEALRPGGRFAKGEPLIWLESRDYELAIEQETARVRQAELELALEQGRAETARQEWALLGSDKPPEQTSLALREPQLANAEAALASARAGLERAELNLQRTVLRAPFDAMVLDEQVDPGQVVGPGSPVATLVGTARVRVNVSLPLADVALLELPGLNAEQGSSATVIQRLEDGSSVSHRGVVAGLSAQLDPQARTARLLVLVDAPLDLSGGDVPLLPGAWVDLLLEGPPVPAISEIPRSAVSDGDTVWVVTTENRLEQRILEVAWRTRDRIFARGGVDTSDRLVPAPPPLAVDGLEVIVHEDGESCEICGREPEAEPAVTADALDEVASP